VGVVFQEGVAHSGLAIPGKHGVDGLGELGAAGLVDAARVDPDIIVAVVEGNLSTLEHLEEARSPARSEFGWAMSGMVIQDLLGAPRVRQSGVRRLFFCGKVFELKRGCIKKPHFDRLGSWSRLWVQERWTR